MPLLQSPCSPLSGSNELGYRGGRGAHTSPFLGSSRGWGESEAAGRGCLRTPDTQALAPTLYRAGASPPASLLWVRLEKSKVSRGGCTASLKCPAGVREHFPYCGLPLRPPPQDLRGSLEKRPPSQLSFCPSLPIRSRRCSECRARPEGHRVSPQSPGGEAAPGHPLQAQGCPPAGLGNRRGDDSPCRASLHRHPPQPAPRSAGSGARPPQGLRAPGTTRSPCSGCPSRGSAHRLLGRLFQGPSTGNERLNGPASERRNSA